MSYTQDEIVVNLGECLPLVAEAAPSFPWGDIMQVALGVLTAALALIVALRQHSLSEKIAEKQRELSKDIASKQRKLSEDIAARQHQLSKQIAQKDDDAERYKIFSAVRDLLGLYHSHKTVPHDAFVVFQEDIKDRYLYFSDDDCDYILSIASSIRAHNVMVTDHGDTGIQGDRREKNRTEMLEISKWLNEQMPEVRRRLAKTLRRVE